jgi:hypothetical protein
MTQEQVKRIMEVMESGMTQREAEAQLGISARTIGKVAKENGFIPNRIEQNRKGQLKSEKNLDRWAEMTQLSLWNRKPKPGNIKAVQRVTTSHVRLPAPDKWSGDSFILNCF